MELIPFLNKIAETSLSLAIVIAFSFFIIRYFISQQKAKDKQISELLKEANERYDRQEERHTAQQNELLKLNQEKDKFITDIILKVTDSIATLTYTNAKAFKSYKNAVENESIKTES